MNTTFGYAPTGLPLNRSSHVMRYFLIFCFWIENATNGGERAAIITLGCFTCKTDGRRSIISPTAVVFTRRSIYDGERSLFLVFLFGKRSGLNIGRRHWRHTFYIVSTDVLVTFGINFAIGFDLTGLAIGTGDVFTDRGGLMRVWPGRAGHCLYKTTSLR